MSGGGSGTGTSKGFSFRIKTANIYSHGEKLAADLYLPDIEGKPPVVVMAHGFGLQRHFGLPPFAECFASAGLAVLLFDYRGFGESQGNPRNFVNPARHLQDWQAAVQTARLLPEVDNRRLGLWGTSFSGGHVLVTAARLSGIRAVVAQIPFVDGFSSSSVFPIKQLPLAISRILADIVAGMSGRPRVLAPVVNSTGLSCLSGPDCEQDCLQLVPEGMAFDNAVPARILFDILFFRPTASVSNIQAPVLIIAARNDSIIPFSAIQRSARKIPNCRLESFDDRHFFPYFGEGFKKASALARDFLLEKL